MTFDPTKPVQTRGGRKARIICTDAKGMQPIVALVTTSDPDVERVERFFLDGRCYSSLEVDSPHDLINVPEEEILNLAVHRTSVNGVLFAAPVGGYTGLLGHVRITVVGDKVTKAEVLP